MFNRYYLGPLSMALTILAIHLANRYAPAWVAPSLALAVIPMTIAQFWGGLRASLVCALTVSMYALLSPDFDYSRTIQIAVSFGFAAWLGGELKRRERHLENISRAMFANGNIEKARDALRLARELEEYCKDKGVISAYLVLTACQQITDRLGNSLAIIDGYRFIRDEIERVNEWYANPANAERLQRMMEAGQDVETQTERTK